MNIPPAPPVLALPAIDDEVNHGAISFHPPLENPPRQWSDVVYHQYLLNGQ
ncbi:MAG: hypothetical protein ACI8RA_003042 [Chlamydiales bacterium]|jgi:hypothetical protein